MKYIGDERFMLTYGDGVSDIDLNALLAQHEASGKVVTLTGIQPGGRMTCPLYPQQITKSWNPKLE